MISPTSAVAEVASRLSGLGGTRWVGVDGLGAAGKTTLAARIAAVVPQAVVIHVDDFARSGVRGWERDRFVDQVLTPLLAGVEAHYQRWDYDADAVGDWCTVPPGRPVVVEGVSALDQRVPVPWDLTLWLESSREQRQQRILEREGESRLAYWRDDWWPNEQAYVAAQDPRSRVDLVVDAALA